MSPLAPTSPNPLSPLLASRSIGQDAANAAQTLSSWNNCMSVAYCKWPVIVAIIIASLIVLSVVICIARCACCGLECCCWCCSCFNRCCPSPRNSKAKYAQAPQQPYQYPPQQPYGYHPGMSYGPPQFATFDASTNKVTEDSLPAMPSWETSQSRKIEDTSYHGAGADDDALDKEMGGSDGIAMGNLNSHHNEPKQYYEDPDETHQPMLDSREQQQHEPEQHHIDENPYQYQENSSYAGTDVGQTHPQNNPTHAYGQYDQQQDPYGQYGQYTANSPTSMYTTSYPPTYHTRPPVAQPYQRAMASSTPYASSPPPVSPSAAMPDHQSYTPVNFSRGQTPNYDTTSPVEPPAEMPGSLVPGGGQRFYSQQQQQQQLQPHELAGRSSGSYRKPVSGNWQ